MRWKVHYDKISTKRTYRWVAADGKKRQSTKQFYQTHSPYNVCRVKKQVKTKEQINSEIHKEAEEWVKGMQLKDKAKMLPGQ